MARAKVTLRPVKKEGHRSSRRARPGCSDSLRSRERALETSSGVSPGGAAMLLPFAPQGPLVVRDTGLWGNENEGNGTDMPPEVQHPGNKLQLPTTPLLVSWGP